MPRAKGKATDAVELTAVYLRQRGATLDAAQVAAATGADAEVSQLVTQLGSRLKKLPIGERRSDPLCSTVARALEAAITRARRTDPQKPQIQS